MMKKILLTALTAVVLLLSACGSDQVTLQVFNWGEFNHPDIGRMFEEEYGIAVIIQHYATNQEMYARLVHQGGDFDVLFPSDYMIERLILENRLAPLNWDNIPNIFYLHPYFETLPFDPQRTYHVPYKWGMFGIIYNTTMVHDPVYSWSILWNDDYAGQIYMYDAARCTLGVALKLLGYSHNTRDITELHAARDLLLEQRNRGLVRAFQGDLIRDSMIAGGAALATIYSGCAWWMMGENTDLNFAIPVEGTQFFVDAMVIPATSTRQAEAEKFINFMMRPDIALLNAEWIGYSTTNRAVLDMLPDYWRNSQVYWPTDEVFARGDMFRDLGDFRQEYYDAFMMVLVGG
ncbi:MAG: ABC transporter substrate-binding protein [Defluviitaleaceae bacterium]|nr:ABC transporter substrate-binding protein [Defluviitaleaceae bacterium]MCL2275980.1 ABC transporter substrate-binding protein [Defluviitaleaceae bacterium]